MKKWVASFIGVVVIAAALLLTSNAGAASKNIWISTCEITARDTTGAFAGPWSNLRSYADNAIVPDWDNDDSIEGAETFAAAVYAIRTGNTAMRDKVNSALLAAKDSLNDSLERWRATPNTVGRQLAPYILAADIIDVYFNYPSTYSSLSSWLSTLLRSDLGKDTLTHEDLVRVHETQPISEGSHSVLAARIFLAQPDSVARLWRFFKSYATRSEYPADAVNVGWGPQDYFTRSWWRKPNNPTQNPPVTVPCDLDTIFRPHVEWLYGGNPHKDWTAISPSNTKTQPAGTDSAYGTKTVGGVTTYCQSKYGLTSVDHVKDINGGLVHRLTRRCKSTCRCIEDTNTTFVECPGGDRNAGFCNQFNECYGDTSLNPPGREEFGGFIWPPDSIATLYSWGDARTLFMQAEMLRRYGYNDVFTRADNAPKRVMDFLYQSGNPLQRAYPEVQNIVFPLAGHRYTQTYEYSPALGAPIEAIGFTDWTHPAQQSSWASPFTAYAIYPFVAVTFPKPVTAEQYDVRYSLNPINTDAQFNAATAAVGEPSPCPATENFSLQDEVGTNVVYYFAMKYRNSADVWSAMSTDTTIMPSGAGGGGCGECLEESARRSRDEGGAAEIKQTMFTVAEARRLTNLYSIDVLGRRVRPELIRPGLYMQHITNAKGVVIEKRKVVVR